MEGQTEETQVASELVMVDAFFMATEDQLSAVEDEFKHKRYYLVEAEPDDA